MFVFKLHFPGEYIFHVFYFTLPVNSWNNLCERNNAFLFMQVVNSSKNNFTGLLWLFETKFNTTQLKHKRGICWLIIEMTEMAEMLGSQTFSPLLSLLVSACLYSLLLESFSNTEVMPQRASSSHPVIFKMQEASGTLLCWWGLWLASLWSHVNQTHYG